MHVSFFVRVLCVHMYCASPFTTLYSHSHLLKMCREYSIHNTTCMYIQLLTLSGGCRGLCNTERTFPLPRKLSISSSEQNSCACEVGEIPSHQEWGYQPGVIHTYWLKFLWAACTQWRREHRKCSVLSLFTYSQCTHTHSQTGTHAYTQVHTPDHTSIFYLGLVHYIMVGMSLYTALQKWSLEKGVSYSRGWHAQQKGRFDSVGTMAHVLDTEMSPKLRDGHQKMLHCVNHIHCIR